MRLSRINIKVYHMHDFWCFFIAVPLRSFFFLYYDMRRIRAKPEVSWTVFSTSIIKKFYIKNLRC